MLFRKNKKMISHGLRLIRSQLYSASVISGFALFLLPCIVLSANHVSGTPSARVPSGYAAEQWIQQQKVRARGLHKAATSVSVMDQLEPYTSNWPNGADEVEEIDQATLKTYFELVRNTRFLREPNDPQFLRRISWLYPLDGCFARASMARELMLANNGPLMKKIFVVGKLTLSWWYHVALITKVNNQLYVIDPALQAASPLTLDGWMKLSHAGASLPSQSEVAICSPYTYTPDDNCLKTTKFDMQRLSTLYAHQYSYLRKEWNWIKSGGKDPAKLLGEEPPWSFLSIKAPVLSPLRL